MFGEPKAVRFQRTVRGEVALMAIEEHEDNVELNSFFDYRYDYIPQWDDGLGEEFKYDRDSNWDYDDFGYGYDLFD